jgi:AraC family transcriptional regulator
MPYTRLVKLQTPLAAWHELTLLETRPDWSEAYRAASPRLLLPRSHWIECELAGRRSVCDSVSPLWVTPDTEYRLRQPWAGQRSAVLIVDAPLPASRRPPMLRPAALLRLARCAMALERQSVDALALEEQVITVVHDALAPPAPVADALAWQHALEARPAGHRTTGRSINRPIDRAIERARGFIASRPHGSETLAQIAAQAGCSAFHLVRQFRQATGIGLHAYRTRLRMAQALQRLCDGEPDLTTLALDLGYSSHSHFSATFRRCFGLSPRQVRSNLTAPLGG